MFMPPTPCSIGSTSTPAARGPSASSCASRPARHSSLLRVRIWPSGPGKQYGSSTRTTGNSSGSNGAVKLDAALTRHGADRIAVVGVVERDERPALGLAPVQPVLPGQLERHFHRRRAVVRVEDAREPRRQQRHQPLGQLHRRRVGAAGEDDVLQRVRLPRQRGVQLRVGVPVDVDPPGRNAVQIAPPVGRVQIHAGAPDHLQRRGRVEHLGVGMPQAGAVARREAVVRDAGHASHLRSLPPGSSPPRTQPSRAAADNGSSRGSSPSTSTRP